ncbi:MAG: ComF family protein [Lachnospiraceae bacterium]|nr:ComF family protein [Lachnospiraceae bacterium]
MNRKDTRVFAGRSKDSLFEVVLDILYPRHCAVCDELLPFGGGLVCIGCERKPLPVSGPRCMKCGRMLGSDREEYCSDCREVIHFYDRAFSVFVYNDVMQQSIYRFKYRGKQEYADFYGESIVRYLGREIESLGADALIPVPLHKDRQKKRGYNQASLIAKKLSKLTGIRLEDDLVRRVAATRPQKNLNREERRKNLKRAFLLSRNIVKLTRVIIVDDIYTTGSTVDEMSLLLKEAGVREVYVVTVCSGSPL